MDPRISLSDEQQFEGLMPKKEKLEKFWDILNSSLASASLITGIIFALWHFGRGPSIWWPIVVTIWVGLFLFDFVCQFIK